MVTRGKSIPMCIYCGEREGRTRDHVPPQCLFGTPRSNLITVPCCEMCRKRQSLDDEYFVQRIVMRNDVGDNPSAAYAADAARRSFTKPKKERSTRALLRSIRQLPIYTDGGLYLGHVPTYEADLKRLCNVIERTTLGLYYYEYGHPLPGSHSCVTYALEGFASAEPEVKAFIKQVMEEAWLGQKRELGNGVFTYCFRELDTPQPVTLWAFLVYSRVEFMSLTKPRADTATMRGATPA